MWVTESFDSGRGRVVDHVRFVALTADDIESWEAMLSLVIGVVLLDSAVVGGEGSLEGMPPRSVGDPQRRERRDVPECPASVGLRDGRSRGIPARSRTVRVVGRLLGPSDFAPAKRRGCIGTRDPNRRHG
jgi:hypothetical protein